VIFSLVIPAHLMVERSLSLVSDRQILTLVLDPLGHRSLLGGFLSEKYLGRPEPQRFELTTQSLSKYKRTIDQWGGWMLFQVSIIPNRVKQEFEKVFLASAILLFRPFCWYYFRASHVLLWFGVWFMWDPGASACA